MSKHAKMTHEPKYPTMREMELLIIVTRLKEMEGNRQRTARSLGIGIRTLQRKLLKYGISHKTQIKQSAKEIQADSVMIANQLLGDTNG
jgi:hypothetical protein